MRFERRTGKGIKSEFRNEKNQVYFSFENIRDSTEHEWRLNDLNSE